jgi:hypothetical protein
MIGQRNKHIMDIYLLQRISSDPSEQSNLPSHTTCLLIHSPLEQVASLSLQALGGRVGGGVSEI